jgi:hypothetical protein
VSDTAATIDRIFAHVGVPTDSRCYQTASGKNDEVATRNEFWKNINKPVFDSGAEGYRKKLSETEIAMIEAVASTMMDKLGYVREATNTWHKPHFFSLREKMRKKQMKRVAFTGDAMLQDKTELVRRIQRGKKA